MSKAPGIIFGAEGRLGKELCRELPTYLAPSCSEVSFSDPQRINEFILDTQPRRIINASGEMDLAQMNRANVRFYASQFVGSAAITDACKKVSAKLVFISSASVFSGKSGNYKEQDESFPANYYGYSKYLIEQYGRGLRDYAVIRADFFVPGENDGQEIFFDHFCSRLSVGELARKVRRVTQSSYAGTIHIGGERDSLFNILKPTNPNIKKISIEEMRNTFFPKDLSLDPSRFKSIFGQ